MSGLCRNTALPFACHEVITLTLFLSPEGMQAKLPLVVCTDNQAESGSLFEHV